MNECSQDLEKAVEREVAAEEWMQSINPNPYKLRKGGGGLTRYPNLSSKVGSAPDQRDNDRNP